MELEPSTARIGAAGREAFSYSGIRSTCVIAAGVEVIFAFCGFEDAGAGFERPYQTRDSPLGDGAGGFYKLLNLWSLVAREIVHDDNIAFSERGNQAFFYPFLEQTGVDRPVVDFRRRQPGKSDAGDQRDRL